MGNNAKKKEELLVENNDLRIRLQEAEETLRAIREGEVDGLVCSGPEGDQLFLLKGAERAYRVFVEAMNEGAVTLSHDGTILYCNDRFAEMAEIPSEKVIGQSIYRFVAPTEAFESAFQRGKSRKERAELLVVRKDRGPLPVYLSFNPLLEDEVPAICVVITDVEALKESEKRVKNLTSLLLQAEEKERRRVALELHDGLMSDLAAAKFLLEGKIHLGERGKTVDPGELHRVADILGGAMKEARRLMNNLHPSMLKELGLIPTIGWVCGEYQKSYSHISVQKEITVSEKDIADSIKVVIYRLLQEALNNFARHGNGDRVSLSLSKSDSTLALTIQDNGQGFDMGKVQKGVGLESMRERVEISGGEFQIESGIGQGTTIRAIWNLQ
jgi:PAS domain S-box-containing protein